MLQRMGGHLDQELAAEQQLVELRGTVKLNQEEAKVRTHTHTHVFTLTLIGPRKGR